MAGLSPWTVSVQTNTRIIVMLLIQGEYEALENITQGRFLSQSDMKQAVDSLTDELIEPPQSVFDRISIVEVTGASPATFLVDFPLWTSKRGRSDVLLKLRMYQGYEQGLKKEILAIGEGPQPHSRSGREPRDRGALGP